MENQASDPSAPKTWLLESVLVTVFCCLPFGIAGIIYASKVERLYSQGNMEEAVKASKEAGKWTKIGFFVGCGLGALYLFITLGILGWFAGYYY